LGSASVELGRLFNVGLGLEAKCGKMHMLVSLSGEEKFVTYKQEKVLNGATLLVRFQAWPTENCSLFNVEIWMPRENEEDVAVIKMAALDSAYMAQL
jgi:hypothetical protein